MQKLNNPIFTAIFFILSTLLLTISVKGSLVDNTGGDASPSLLVSQQIVENGTVKLNPYFTTDEAKTNTKLRVRGENIYYYFPVGSSLASAPFVIIANHFGYRMEDGEGAVQNTIAAITIVAIIALLFLVAHLYLDYATSSILSIVFVFGTSYVSTLGTALWSHNWASVFVLASLYIGLRAVKLTQCLAWYAVLIGIFLFMAYLCRPTLSLYAIALVVYLFLHNKRFALIAAGVTWVLLVAFGVFSYEEFGQVLPDYYMPSRLSKNPEFWTALAANLISPSRGLFVFSPFVLITLIYLKEVVAFFREEKYIWLFSVWALFHLITISNFQHWWAGFSYGPRFMIDVLPAFYILLIAVFQRDKPWSFVAKVYFYSAVIFAIIINYYQGLFNPYTMQWNREPNIDKNHHLIWDWSFPQFLHSPTKHTLRISYYLEQIEKQEITDDVTLNSSNFDSYLGLIYGWSKTESWGVWSIGNKSRISFAVCSDCRVKSITLRGRYFRSEKTTKVFVNDIFYGEMVLRDKEIVLNDVSTKEVVVDLIHVNPQAPYNVNRGSKDIRPIEFGLESVDVTFIKN